MKNLTIALAAVVVTAGCSRDIPPNSYEDCILTELEGSQNTAAVEAIKEACRLKFPVPEPEPLTPEQAAAAATAQSAADTAAAAADAAAADAGSERPDY